VRLAVRDRATAAQLGLGLPPMLGEMLGVVIELCHRGSRFGGFGRFSLDNI
jgi:hypothetical protein